MTAASGGDLTADPIPVLVYHAVNEIAPPDLARYTLTPARFAEHVGAIAASGRVALTITELAAALRAQRPLPDRAMAVTFDDGYVDTPAAVAALAERGIASTVFVTTGRIGSELPAAALDELGRIEQVELGAHTVSHPYLDELAPGQASREILDSRLVLQERAGRAVETFAYPHGAYDQRVRASVITAGFTCAAAVKNALSHRADDPFAIARWTVHDDTPHEQITAVLEGRSVPLAWSKERHRTRAYRYARRARRRLYEARSGILDRR